MSKIFINHYVDQLTHSQHGENWLDENFTKKLDQVSEADAFMIPATGIHSIAEVISHVIEWRKELLRRLIHGQPAILKMESPENWISNEALKKDGWVALVKKLQETHDTFIDFLAKNDDSFFDLPWKDKQTNGYLVAGWLEHDLYHLGQVGLIYKMLSVQGMLSR
jgi:uncharacterized damage-inducible protein DinB